MKMVYDKHYFIRKFSAIPDELWRDDGFMGNCKYNGPCCVLGHCYTPPENDEIIALIELFPRPSSNTFSSDPLTWLFMLPIAAINDGHHLRYQQSTPKARILAALYDLPDTI